MIKLISHYEVNKAIDMSAMYIRLRKLYTIEELIAKYEEDKPKLVRKTRDLPSKAEHINKYNFSFDFHYNSTISANKNKAEYKEQIISVLINFERTRYFLRHYTTSHSIN